MMMRAPPLAAACQASSRSRSPRPECSAAIGAGEAGLEALDELRRQADLRAQHQHRLAAGQHRRGDPQVDLGLAAAGHAIEQEAGAASHVTGDRVDRLLLRNGQRRASAARIGRLEPQFHRHLPGLDQFPATQFLRPPPASRAILRRVVSRSVRHEPANAAAGPAAAVRAAARRAPWCHARPPSLTRRTRFRSPGARCAAAAAARWPGPRRSGGDSSRPPRIATSGPFPRRSALYPALRSPFGAFRLARRYASRSR